MKLNTVRTMTVAALLLLTVASFRAADTLPAQLSDAAYWKMISEFSEPDVPSTRFDEWLTLGGGPLNWLASIPDFLRTGDPRIR